MIDDVIKNLPADNTYCQIQYWMRRKLGLKGTALLLYGLIHGFSQDGVSVCYAPLEYMTEMTGLSKQAVITLLKKLVEKNLVIKQTVKQYIYQTKNGPRIVKASGCQFFCVYFTVESRKQNNIENPNQPKEEEKTPHPVNPEADSIQKGCKYEI